MNDSEWEGRDEELLNLLGNVRQNDDTTMGTQYNVSFYESFAERLSGIVHASISPEDVGDRIKKFREIFQSYQTGADMYTHPVIENDRFRALLRRCYFQEVKPIKVPRCLTNNPNNPSRRSRRTTSGCSGSQSVDQAPTDNDASMELQLTNALSHLFRLHRDRFNPNTLTLFVRYLDNNPRVASVFLTLGHEDQLLYIEALDLQHYRDPWPRN